jgi:hypothetical protein
MEVAETRRSRPWLDFREGCMCGVELALDGADASLLSLVGVPVTRDDASVSASWLALIAFSRTAGLKLLVDFRRRDFWTRALVEATAGCARSDGHAHSDVLGIV